MLVRGSAGVLGVGVIAAILVAGASALRSRARAGAATQAPPANPPDSSSMPARIDSTPTASSTSDGATALVTMARAMSSASVPATTQPAIGAGTPAQAESGIPQPALAGGRSVVPIIPVGRTALRDTMIAERAGDTVRVRFDLLLTRTRRPEKFEAIVRATLPQVFGAPADSALRALPAGVVARAGDLVTTLPERGFQIPLASGYTIAVWPETRAGRDGPLVVAYRAVASR